MKIHYDRQEDILMIEMVAEGIIDHAEHTGPIIAHLSPEGQLVVLEILDASEFLASLIKATLRHQEEDIPLSAS
jgi:uncharacterized protein YuzE